MARHHSSKHEGMYEGADARRKQEREDSSMFGASQHQHFANMPTEVIFKTVGQPHSGMPEGLDDTMKGVDRQIGKDEMDLHKHLHPKKV